MDEPSLLITFSVYDQIYPSVAGSCGSCSSSETNWGVFLQLLLIVALSGYQQSNAQLNTDTELQRIQVERLFF